MTTSSYRWHTIQETFDQICNNQAPWVAIGNFLNDWWFFAVEYRREMIEQPPAKAATQETQRWAAFCAAMVEWLCVQDNVLCPNWTKHRRYMLADPWFFYEDDESRAWLMATTPAPFKMRNIYGGDRMFKHVDRATPANREPHRR